MASANLLPGGDEPSASFEWVRTGLYMVSFLGAALACLRTWLGPQLVGRAAWPDELLLGAVAAATIATLMGRLPAQNVFLVSTLIGLLGSGAEGLARTGALHLSLGLDGQGAGGRFLPVWVVPVRWVALVLNSRGAAQVLLRPLRKSPRYGLWLLGLATLLVVVLEIGLAHYVWQANHYGRWFPVGHSLARGALAGTELIAWTGVPFSMLSLAAPWLINKKPVECPPDSQPLWLWLSLNCLFVAALIAPPA